MSANTDTIGRYLDGFRNQDRELVLSCLTDDIDWIVYGWYHITGKEAYGENIGGEGFVGNPQLDVVRLVEQDDVVMGEIAGRVQRNDGGWTRLAMAETWVMRDALICERRSYVITLEHDDWH